MDQHDGSPRHSTYCYAELAASSINFLHYCSPMHKKCILIFILMVIKAADGTFKSEKYFYVILFCSV